MMKQFAIATATLGTALTLSAFGAESVSASTLSFTDVTTGGTYAPVQSVSPGFYGAEIRGGRAGRADWELGVGEQTSNLGTFNQGEHTWATEPVSFSMDWSGSSMNINVGNSSVSRDFSWTLGNTLAIFAKREAELTITEVNGQSLAGSIAGTPGSGVLNSLFVTSDSVPTEWSLQGFIKVAGGRGSANSIGITTGNYTPNSTGGDVEPIPEPLTVMGTLMAAGIGYQMKRKRAANQA
jgi:hypothetical protein